MRAATRLPRAVLLGAMLLVGACADEPAPQHPTSSHSKKKHKKKHADADEVVVSDDTQDDDTAADTRKKHHADAEKTDDDEPKKKSDEDAPKKKHRVATKDLDDDEPKHPDEDAPKKKHRVATKGRDDDGPKKSDEDEPKKSDEDEPKTDDADAKKDDAAAEPKSAERAHTTKRAPKKPARKVAKHKRAEAKKPAKSDEPAAGEIEMDEDPLAGGARETTADAPTGADEENEASAAVAAPMPAPAPPISSLAINDRGLIVRHGALEVHGGLRTSVLTLPGLMPGTSTSSTSEGLALGAAYGIGDKAEIGGDYTLSLSPGSVKGPLTFHAAYLAYVRPKLDIAIAGALAVDFQDSTDPTTMKTTTLTSYGLELGGWVRYRATPKVTLFTGLPALPASTASLSKLSFALPPLPYQLAIGLSGGSAIALDVPVGVGVQAAPAVYVFAMTNLAHLKISNTANAFLFADFIPLTLGGFYSLPKIDVGATFADDLKQGTGYLSFVLLARYAIQ